MIKKCFLLAMEKLERILPDWCCGRRDVLEEKYRSKYGEKDWKGKATLERRRMAGLYLVIFLIFLPMLLIQSTTLLLDLFGKELRLFELPRPAYGEGSRPEHLKVNLQYKDIVMEQEMILKVPSKELTEKETENYLKKYKKELPQKILGENSDTGHIFEDLKLPVTDGDLELEWHSEKPNLINEKGQVNFLGVKDGEKVVLTAFITFKHLREELQIPLIISLPEETEFYKKALRRELKNLTEELERRGSKDPELPLPKVSSSGAALQWSRTEESPFPGAFFFFPLTLFLTYQQRYRRLNRKLQEEKEAMEEEFPEFINRLILLLSAGLVPGSALNKIIGDYEEQKWKSGSREKNPLYEALAEVGKRVRETNSPLSTELSLMARKSGIRELMRFCAILEDSVEKGTVLIKKLEAERNLIWQGRKKEAERKGRVAETKLTFPLTVLLLVLVMITISPVLLDV